MSTASFEPLVANTGEAMRLSMQRLWLTGQVLPAGARLVAQHVFQSLEEKPCEVIYSFPLPRDAALRKFRIEGEDFEAHSELEETAAAVKKYERGITRGSLSVLARQYSDGVMNLTVGNIRPQERVTVHVEILCGVELRDGGFRFRFPFTLAPNYHPDARIALTGPGEGEMELPAAEFGDVILPPFRKDASRLHQIGFELSTVNQLPIDEIGSPSHALRVKQDGDRTARIALAAAKDVPDRDLVLDVSYRSIEPQVLAGRDNTGKIRFAAIVPSSSFGTAAESPRRVVILFDRSGSMSGEPIAQARNAIDACLGTLSDQDSFGLVAFDDRVQTFQPALVPGTREMRDRAHKFLRQVDARGGTELVQGFLEAARILNGGGDILILTDGQVAGTEVILSEARSAGVRLHCLGIGSASQDRFLTLLARETGGVSRFVTPRERVDMAAVDLFASIGAPVVSGLKAGENVQPAPASQVFPGTPVLLFGEAGEAPDDRIELSWSNGRLNLPVATVEGDVGETVWLLQGSRLITDWESRFPGEKGLAPLERRKQNRVATRLAELSQTYGLASREMSLIAVVKRQGDRAGELPDTRVVPVGMPQDMIFDGFCGHADVFGTVAVPLLPTPPAAQSSGAPTWSDLVGRFFGKRSVPTPMPAAAPLKAEDLLLDLASRMESDGGMPGADKESRAIATAIALLAFLSQGHGIGKGAFRSHVTRLLSFLESLGESSTGLSSDRRRIVRAVVERVRKGDAPEGDWIRLATMPGDHWHEVEEACQASRSRV